VASSSALPEGVTSSGDELEAHRYAIETLARQLDLPTEVVAEHYLAQLAELSQGAVVKDYLIVLTLRHVRGELMASTHPR
jgi:hypothetical protein